LASFFALQFHSALIGFAFSMGFVGAITGALIALRGLGVFAEGAM
jgi:hypothetical protein